MNLKDDKNAKNELDFDYARFFPQLDDASTLTVAVFPDHYSASVIARAVEDCDAHLLNLNVLADRTAAGELLVMIRVDHRDVSAVARSIERFDYRVVEASGVDDTFGDTARERVNELLRYLEV